MGFYIFSYAINAGQIKDSLGSCDQDLYDYVSETKIFSRYARGDSSGDLSMKEALHHLIFGEPYNHTSIHSYWYCLIALCAYLGEDLAGTHEIKLRYETDIIDALLIADFDIDLQIEDVLLGQLPPFGIPAPTDFPVCGIVQEKELLELQTAFKDIHITDEQLEQLLEEDDEKEMAYDSIRQIKQNVAYCIENNRQLISFCH